MKGLVIVAWLTFVVNQEISRRRAMKNVVVEGRASMLAHAVPIAFGASVLILSSLLTARVSFAGGGMWPWVGRLWCYQDWRSRRGRVSNSARNGAHEWG